MKNKEQYDGEWVLLDKKGEVIAHSKNVIQIIEKGKKFTPGDVSIEQKLAHGTCFF